MYEDLPNISADSLNIPALEQLQPVQQSAHKPRILLLYGSTRQRSLPFSGARSSAFARNLWCRNPYF